MGSAPGRGGREAGCVRWPVGVCRMKGNSAPAATATFIGIGHAAQLLSVSVRLIESLIVQGRFPAPCRFGRTRRWRVDEILEWAEKQRVGRRGVPR